MKEVFSYHRPVGMVIWLILIPISVVPGGAVCPFPCSFGLSITSSEPHAVWKTTNDLITNKVHLISAVNRCKMSVGWCTPVFSCFERFICLKALYEQESRRFQSSMVKNTRFDILFMVSTFWASLDYISWKVACEISSFWQISPKLCSLQRHWKSFKRPSKTHVAPFLHGFEFESHGFAFLWHRFPLYPRVQLHVNWDPDVASWLQVPDWVPRWTHGLGEQTSISPRFPLNAVGHWHRVSSSGQWTHSIFLQGRRHFDLAQLKIRFWRSWDVIPRRRKTQGLKCPIGSRSLFLRRQALHHNQKSWSREHPQSSASPPIQEVGELWAKA